MRLHNMTSIQEWHLSIGFDPDLVAGVFGKDGEGGDVESEFASLGELAWEDISIEMEHGR
jgi:hypothetical protein